MEHAAVVDGDNLGAAIGKVPRETAPVHAVDRHEERRGSLGGRAHRLTLLANECLIRHQRHLMGRADARRHVVDLGEADLRWVVGERCTPARSQGESPCGTEQRSREPHSASSSARRRGTDVFSGRMPTLSA